MAESIRTFTEGTRDNKLQSEISSALETSSKLVFLGFAYHSLNMELLHLRAGKVNKKVFKNVYGTVYGQSSQNIRSIEKKLLSLYSGYIAGEEELFLVKGKCNEIFDTCSIGLSAW